MRKKIIKGLHGKRGDKNSGNYIKKNKERKKERGVGW